MRCVWCVEFCGVVSSAFNVAFGVVMDVVWWRGVVVVWCGCKVGSVSMKHGVGALNQNPTTSVRWGGGVLGRR